MAAFAAFEIGPKALGRAKGLLDREGSDTVELGARHVQNVALALHALTTSAVKGEAGRLRVPGSVGRTSRGHPRLVLDWIESGVGLPPEAVVRRGSGRELIGNALS